MTAAAATRRKSTHLHDAPQHRYAWGFDAEDGRWIDAEDGTAFPERERRAEPTPTRTRTCPDCEKMHKAGQEVCEDEWTAKGVCPKCFLELPLTGVCDCD